jgi:hypothetical protein
LIVRDYSWDQYCRCILLFHVCGTVGKARRGIICLLLSHRMYIHRAFFNSASFLTKNSTKVHPLPGQPTPDRPNHPTIEEMTVGRQLVAEVVSRCRAEERFIELLTHVHPSPTPTLQSSALDSAIPSYIVET